MNYSNIFLIFLGFIVGSGTASSVLVLILFSFIKKTKSVAIDPKVVEHYNVKMIELMEERNRLDQTRNEKLFELADLAYQLLQK